MLASVIGMVFLFFIQTVKSAVFFPSNSAYGIFAALALPLDLGPHRNVFISYNFEANYNLPVNWQLPAYVEFGDTRKIKNNNHEEYSITKNTTGGVHTEPKTSDQFQAVKQEHTFSQNSTGDNSLEIESVDADIISRNDFVTTNNATVLKETKINPVRRSLLSRRNFYSMLRQRLPLHGYNGQSCLLRLICETNMSKIGEINGFLGSVMHIMFSPSSSRDEQISNVYYKAAFDGQQSRCRKYSKKCPENILNLISTSVNDLIKSLEMN